MSPDIVALCETKRPAKTTKDELLKGYEVKERNLRQGKEGMMVGAKQGTFKNIQDITESPLKNIMTVAITYSNFVVRVILIHAPQETEKMEVKEEFFEELATQIERGRTSPDIVLLVGDFNGRMDEVDGVITGLSSNGKLAADVINEYNLRVCNFSRYAEGKWTRVRARKDGNIEKSSIDYALVTAETYSTLKSFLVDESKVYCPYHEKMEKGVKRTVFSDHCAFVLKLELDPGSFKTEQHNRKVWNFNEDGYMQFEQESKIGFNVQGNTATGAYDKWESGFKKILRRCFKKKTIGKTTMHTARNNNDVRNVLKQLAKKGRVQRKVAQSYMTHLVQIETKQRAQLCAERLKRTMKQLSVEDKFSPSGYWKLKAAAGRKPKREMNSVVKENGDEITGKSGIIDAYRSEFEHRLRNRNPEPEWEDYVKRLNETIQNWLRSKSPSSSPFTLEELVTVIKNLKKGKARGLDGYPVDLFKRAGEGLLKAILELFNIIKEAREVPEQWHLMKIVTIYKKKGSKKQLKYYRGIFLAIAISKVFEGMIKLRIEPNLEKVNILQAGSRKKRGGPDNVFLLRGTIDHYKYTKNPLYYSIRL